MRWCLVGLEVPVQGLPLLEEEPFAFEIREGVIVRMMERVRQGLMMKYLQRLLVSRRHE